MNHGPGERSSENAVATPALLQAASRLARRGVAVFPVGTDKAPRTPRGFKDATTSIRQINAWNWNDCMIGAAIQEGEFVLDVDPRNGGVETLSVFPELPKTRTTRTKSGGWHYWFTCPPELSLRGTLGPGVDVKRAGKGYVVVPPSPGYAWIVGGDKVAVPGWLLDELVVIPRNDCDTFSRPKFFPFEEGTSYGLAALRNAVEQLKNASNGARNDSLNKSAFTMAQLYAGGELDREATVVALLRVAEKIGLGAWEARNTIESGWRAGEQHPRQAPK